MKKFFLYLIVIFISYFGLVGCSDSKDKETILYVGTISYVQIESSSSSVVTTPILDFFKEKMTAQGTMTTSKSAFVFSCSSDKQESVTKGFQDAKEELLLLMENKLKEVVISCDVTISLGSKEIMNVVYHGTPENSEGGHASTEGTVPGFNWQ